MSAFQNKRKREYDPTYALKKAQQISEGLRFQLAYTNLKLKQMAEVRWFLALAEIEADRVAADNQFKPRDAGTRNARNEFIHEMIQFVWHLCHRINTAPRDYKYVFGAQEATENRSLLHDSTVHGRVLAQDPKPPAWDPVSLLDSRANLARICVLEKTPVELTDHERRVLSQYMTVRPELVQFLAAWFGCFPLAEETLRIQTASSTTENKESVRFYKTTMDIAFAMGHTEFVDSCKEIGCEGSDRMDQEWFEFGYLLKPSRDAEIENEVKYSELADMLGLDISFAKAYWSEGVESVKAQECVVLPDPCAYTPNERIILE